MTIAQSAFRLCAVLLAVFVWLAMGPDGRAEAKGDPHSCTSAPAGVLKPHQDGDDLILRRDCLVGAGTYKLGNVHILDGGTLRFADANIDFWAENIVVEKGGSLLAGVDKDGKITPIASGVVTIHLYGADQTGQDPAKLGTGVVCRTDPPTGQEPSRCGVPKDIWDSNGAQKISALASASTYLGVKDDYFYPYHSLPLDGADPNGYVGYKVLAVTYGGTLRLYGKKGATYDGAPECGEAATSTSGTSWARLGATAQKGTSTLTVDRKLSLKAGDQIVVTTTDYLPGHSEELTVSGDVACGTTITVKETLKYDHVGVRYALTDVPEDRKILDPTLRSAGAETRAAVGLLSKRNIRIVSAGDTRDQEFPAEPAKDAGYFFGGHLIALQGFKTFQVQGVEFYQMGQGGRLGHYPIHFHHARKTPADTYVKDSSIHDSMTRWITLHGTQGVTLERNVGYKSIGHGFYLEDGTETDNKLIANLGVFARAAVANVQNPRKVPGILAAPNVSSGEGMPNRSDYTNPTVFWIMNGWNDFQDNMAAGAGTCGACYWLVPGWNSGLSNGRKWESYASMQDGNQQSGLDRAGTTPLKSFVGNSCTTAMTSFQTVGSVEQCLGVDGPAPSLPQVRNPLAKDAGDADYYPHVNGGGRFATRCPEGVDCSTTTALPRCGLGHLENCMVTVLDRYTTSFNWAPLNFGAIWLRPQWYLVSNSVITDVQQAGLTFVTGGGYTAADVVPGHWALVRNSVFIGHTQENNPFASDGGPFNPSSGLTCALDGSGHRPANYCVSVDEGVSHQISNFGMYQRLFSIYDGPAFQDSNAYLNITHRKIDDCKPTDAGNELNPAGKCAPNDQNKESAWLAGIVLGLPKATDLSKTDFCFMPNAAIGWKQPNGFYYPPALHSTNLFFKDVDTRHFVVTPRFTDCTSTLGSNCLDTKRAKAEYCVWNDKLFSSFTDIDRETVLNDDDGTLTGFKNSTVVNMDDFFLAPVEAIECKSDNTSLTSPYQYVTTAVYPKCRAGGETCAGWGSQGGVPLYRLDLLPTSDKNPPKSILMTGQDIGQRSTLTVNNGTYYLDTANPDSAFEPSHTYYLFLVYATEDTQQTYRFYVGEDFDPASINSISMVQANIEPNPLQFNNVQPLPQGKSMAQWLGGNKATAKGVVEVRLRVKDFPDVAAKYKAARKNKCQPASYCTWKPDTETCVDATGSDMDCHWGGAHPECPDGGCIGIAFTLPATFKTLDKPETVRPAAACIPKDFTDEDGKKVWDVSLNTLTPGDGLCPDPNQTMTPDFCK